MPQYFATLPKCQIGKDEPNNKGNEDEWFCWPDLTMLTMNSSANNMKYMLIRASTRLT